MKQPEGEDRLPASVDSSAPGFEEMVRSFDLFPCPVLLVSLPDRLVLYANPEILAYCGDPPEGVEGRALRELSLWRDAEGIREVLESLTAGTRATDRPIRVTTPGRVERFLELSSRHLRVGEENVALLTARDVTKQVQAREEIRQTQERLSALLQGVQDMVFRHDAQGNYLDIHAPRPEMFLIPPEDLIGANFHDVGLPPDLVEKVDEAIKAAAEEDRPQVFRYELPLENGGHNWEMRLTPIRDGEFYAIVQNIDVRVRAEESLRASEELFRTIFRHSPLGLAVVGPDETFLEANDELERLLGYTREEFRERGWADVTLPEDVQKGRDIVEDLVSGRHSSRQIEKRYRRKDGRIVWAELTAALARDAKGEPAYFISHVQDISERKKAEIALKDAEERYRTMFVENQSVMLMIDPGTGGIQEANARAEAFYGYEPGTLCRMNITDLNVLPPEKVRKRMAEARERRRGHFLFQHRLADGSVKDVQVHSGPLHLHDKTLLYSIVHDVTDRVQAEKALEMALKRYRILFQGVSDTVIIHRPDGRIVEVNDVACEQLGYARSELVGRKPPSVLGPEDAEKYEERARQLLEDGGRRIFESSHVRKDGTIMPVEVVAQPLDVGGEQLIVSVVRDLTHRKREQEQRVRAERLEATATLTAGFAHDINNLMAGILGNAGLVEEDLNQGREPDREPLQAILEAAKEAGELAHQLLTYAGGGSFLPKQLRVNGVVRKALETMASSVGPDVIVEVDLGAEDDQLFADQGQVEMIVGNLLKNALEAVGDSGRILVRSENFREERAGSSEDAPVVAEWFRLTFRDDGEGMDTFTMDHMFEPFFSSRFTGRGMGLAAVHGAVRHLQGRIGVESDPGAGTTIRIEIPL